MQEMLTTLIRTAIGFVLLLLLTRIIGNKQLGQLNVFTYISGIAIGNMAGDMIIHRDVTLPDAIGGMVIWGIFTLAVEFISLKSTKARVLLDGEPKIVIKKGQIEYETLRRERLNLDDLTMLLRTNEVFSVQDVEYAILEPNGELSVMKKAERENVTRKDMNIVPAPILGIPSEIIADGKVVEQNLAELGLTRKSLDEKLKQAGVKNPSEVLYAELDSSGALHFQRYK